MYCLFNNTKIVVLFLDLELDLGDLGAFGAEIGLGLESVQGGIYCVYLLLELIALLGGEVYLFTRLDFEGHEQDFLDIVEGIPLIGHPLRQGSQHLPRAERTRINGTINCIDLLADGGDIG